MTGKEFYEEGQKQLSASLKSTPYTHIHSEDVRVWVNKCYFIPAANLGYIPAILEMYDYYSFRNDFKECLHWIGQYRKVTKCSNGHLMRVFGIDCIKKSFRLWI